MTEATRTRGKQNGGTRAAGAVSRWPSSRWTVPVDTVAWATEAVEATGATWITINGIRTRTSETHLPSHRHPPLVDCVNWSFFILFFKFLIKLYLFENCWKNYWCFNFVKKKKKKEERKKKKKELFLKSISKFYFNFSFELSSYILCKSNLHRR